MVYINFTSFPFIILVFCFVAFTMQLYYFLGLYSRLYKCSRKQNMLPGNVNCPPLSVVMVTKDSASALKENLPVILEQDYPDYEVIVVNDESAGEDEDMLKIFEAKYRNLYHTFIPKSARYISRKKLGVAMGIKASRYEWIILTEPCCQPVGKNWLRNMARHFTPGTDIVLGYCNYNPGKGLFAKRVTSSLLLDNMRFLGRALGKSAYMGLGRNLAFRKEAYEKHKGFSKQLQLLRGEDDLFINEIATKNNVKVEVSSDSIVRMPQPGYKRIWYGEKIGYEVTGKLYKGNARLLNSVETWSAVLFNVTVMVSVVYGFVSGGWLFAAVAGVLGVARLSLVMNVFIRTSKVMGESVGSFFLAYIILRPLYSLSLKLRYMARTKADYMRR